MSFNDFALIPADDPQSSPADDLDAAVQGALAIADEPTPVTETAAVPFGRTGLFDWTTGQFVKRGTSVVMVTGLDALAQWCEMAIHTARYSSPILSDDFGMETPDSAIGSLLDDEVIADWQANLVDALLVHERITAVRNVALRWDPSVGILWIDSLDVITDEDETQTVSNIALQTGGAG